MAVVAKLHRVQVYCAAGEFISDWSIERIQFVIRHHDLIGIPSWAKDEGRKHEENGHSLDREQKLYRKLKDKEIKKKGRKRLEKMNPKIEGWAK